MDIEGRQGAAMLNREKYSRFLLGFHAKFVYCS
jgi:hypothetical protein